MEAKKRVVLSWSGGKDSALALESLRNGSEFDVVALLTSVTRGYDRISVHGVRRSLLYAQAESVGLPLVEVMLEQKSSNDAYESAFHDALRTVRQDFPRVRHIAFGDLFLQDVRAYRERLLAGTGFDPVVPIWGTNTTDLARAFIDSGYSARLVCVDTTQLDASFAGREFDMSLLADLPETAD
ncbi:MAG: ATP-binding protein, partial [Gemmatimonadaceae bacterium]